MQTSAQLKERLAAILASVIDSLGGDAGLLGLWDQNEAHFAETIVLGTNRKAVEQLEQNLEVLSDGNRFLSHPTSESADEGERVMLFLNSDERPIGIIQIRRPAPSCPLKEATMLALARQVTLSVDCALQVAQLAQGRRSAEKTADVISSTNDDLGSVLLSTVSHELQTPIAIIKAYAATLARPDANWSIEFIREKLIAIDEETDRLSGMVNKLLYASRLEAGRVPLNRLQIHLGKIAEREAQRFRGLTENHAIEVDFPADFPTVRADPERITEVFANLLDNAVKFSPNGGNIAVHGSFNADSVCVSFEDQGIGILEQDQMAIFDRFHRAGSGLAQQIKGSGLGLYICKALIEAHGDEGVGIDQQSPS